MNKEKITYNPDKAFGETTPEAIVISDLDSILKYLKPEQRERIAKDLENREVRLNLMEAQLALEYGKDQGKNIRSTNIPKDANPMIDTACNIADRLVAVGTGFTWDQALYFAVERLAEERGTKLPQGIAKYLKK